MNPTNIEVEIAREYEAVHSATGVFSSNRGVVYVAGPDALSYLQGQLTQDISRLGVGESLPSLVLQPDGSLLAVVRVTRVEPSRFLLDVEVGVEMELEGRLRRFLLRTDATVESEVASFVALRGPGAPSRSDLADAAASVVLAPVGQLSSLGGCDIIGPGALALVPATATRLSDATFRALRIESGTPSMLHDLRGRVIPAEAGLITGNVSFSKGCYTGQELVERLDSRGAKVARRLCGVVIDSHEGDPGFLTGVEIFSTDPEIGVGRLTSVAWCPGIGAVAGLSFIHRNVDFGAAVRMITPSREKVMGTVRELPLVK